MIQYKCRSCNQDKIKFKTDLRKSPREWKYVDHNGVLVSGKLCAACYLSKQREKRNKSNNQITKKYEKTHKGFLMRTYRNMKSRICGIQKLKAHLYAGKELLNKDEFYSWSMADHKFHELFNIWQESNYNRRLTPSIDRIDTSKGYLLGNIQWIEHWINSQKGCYSRYNK